MQAFVYLRGLLLVMLLAFATGCASDAELLTDASCHIQDPPPDAGELAPHGRLMKVHPRISSIPSGFSGCQTLWVKSPDGWETSRILLRKGRVIGLFDAKLQCRYAGGKLQSGRGGECPTTEPELIPTEPAGCISQHVGGPKPRGACVDDFPAPPESFEPTRVGKSPLATQLEGSTSK